MPQHDAAYKPAYVGRYQDEGFPDKYSCGMIRTVKELLPILEEYNKQEYKIFCFDFETSTLDIENRGKVVGVSFSFDGRRAWYIPLGHNKGDNAEEGMDKFLVACIMSSDVALAFNVEFEYRCLRRLGWDIKDILLTDVLNIVWNVDVNATKLNLKKLEKDILGWVRPDFEETFGKGNTPELFSPEDNTRYRLFLRLS